MGEVVPQANVSRALWGTEDASRTETAGLGDPRPEHALGCCEEGARFLLCSYGGISRHASMSRPALQA